MPREEQIRAAISDMDSEVLKDTLAILLAENKISAPEQKNELRGDFQNFAQVILELKRKYKFPELNYFSTEADLVYVQAGDRRVLLTDKTVTPPPRPAEPRPVESDYSPEKNESQNNAEQNVSEEDAFENIKPGDTRFSHLEF